MLTILGDDFANRSSTPDLIHNKNGADEMISQNDMKRPFFSIITVCLNAPYIESTCKSIISQTFKDFEWIVIDGGSKCEVQNIWKIYKPHIHYFVSEPDDGIYHAMNKGIEQASGDYLIFMNGGDSFVGRHILHLAHEKLAENSTIDVLYGETNMPYIDGDNWVSSTPSESKIEKALFTGSIRHQASFINRHCFEKYGMYDMNHEIVSDWKFFVTLQINGASFLRWNCIVANCSPYGISMNNRRIALLDRKQGMDELYSRSEQLDLYKKYIIMNLRTRIRLKE